MTAETARRAAAAPGTDQSFGSPDSSQRSPVVEEAGTSFALVAYEFDPGGHPVQVVALRNGVWSVVAALPPPVDPGTVSHPDTPGLYGDGVDQVHNLAGHLAGGSLAFFMPQTSAGCTHGAVVSNVGGTWRYLAFGPSSPATQVVGGNPRFVGDALVSDDDCFATATATQGSTETWRYNPRSGDLVVTVTAGWPNPPTWTY